MLLGPGVPLHFPPREFLPGQVRRGLNNLKPAMPA